MKRVKEMTKLTLKQMILNEIDNGVRGYSEELARISGAYSSGSALKKVLKDEKKEFEKFNGLINIVRHIWGNDSINMMVMYSKEIHPNKKTARNLLECLVTNREFEAFKDLLDRMDICTNKESQEWAKVYRLQYRYELAQTPEECNTLLREISLTHVTVSELKTYQKMLLSYCFNQLENFTMVNTLTNEIKQEIELIENDYIKDTFTVRANELIAFNHLKVYNDPEAARQCADNILSSNPRIAFKAYAMYIKGFSFLYTSHENAIQYLNESIELYESLNRQNDVKILKEKAEFISVYWGQFNNEKCSFISNQLLLDVKKGKDISNELLENKDSIDTEFYLYLDGCNSKSNKQLMLSLIKYIKKNDKFLANIAKIELLKNGYDQDILEELTN